MDIKSSNLLNILQQLNDIGIALSAEKDHARLLELILTTGKSMTNADGGTLYLCKSRNILEFEIVHNDSLALRMGGVSDTPVSLPPVRLFSDGRKNLHNVVACCVLKNQTINIEDAYENAEFDFSGTRAFDQQTGYRSKSFLAVPLSNHEGEIIGVLQLINATDKDTGEIKRFSATDQKIVESLASQAAVTLTNKQLIDAQKKLFDAFLQLIASAIDEKSPYTASHCLRVPELTKMIAEATCAIDYGVYKDFNMTDADMYQLSVAAWLHDCGKISTPESVTDKSTKLEKIFDRIELIDTRFEVLKRDAEIAALKRRLKTLGDERPYKDQKFDAELQGLDDDRQFIRECNVGGEMMSADMQQRVEKIAHYRWRNTDGREGAFLSADEVYNLNIPKGTLTPEERDIINHHIVVTINMLEALPYPKHLLKVPEYAGGHHEKMDGTGYPKGLTREQMSVPARMMGIADVFEALTADDRPYKKAMPLSKALTILGNMKLSNHIDGDLFDVFIWKKVYQRYADSFLPPEQCDHFELQEIPGYVAPPKMALDEV